MNHPLEIHHIVPVHSGGTGEFNNLILLCKNHHDLADSGALPQELLLFYKRRAREGYLQFPNDPTAIFELTVNRLTTELESRYDARLVQLAYELLSRLQRETEPRYRRVCLELMLAIVKSSMHESKPRVTKLAKLERMGREMANQLGEDGQRYAQMIRHYLGLAYHKSAQYRLAKEAFQSATSTTANIAAIDDLVVADRTLMRVHEAATDHLSGSSDEALDSICSIIEDLPSDSPAFADAYALAQAKLAEHMLVRGTYDRAQDILESVTSKEVMGNIHPVHHVILLKDLGRTQILLGNRGRGIRLFVKAMALAEASGFDDQCRKIAEVATQLAVAKEELETNRW